MARPHDDAREEWRGPRGRDLLDVVGVADDRRDLVPRLDEHRCEQEGDLAVAAEDGDPHGPTVRGGGRRSSVERRRTDTAEHHRLAQGDTIDNPWRSRGPYVSARQWGTVRED